ncbi:paraplegin isoform X2 [Diprion similis]|uniref:paraplegin isoform X2 n=1 Tax=Diprion similis TaxID=362088 RepID=UPI001EF90B93|nr:paraplegin isoform X2 [Diprion similis]
MQRVVKCPKRYLPSANDIFKLASTVAGKYNSILSRPDFRLVLNRVHRFSRCLSFHGPMHMRMHKEVRAIYTLLRRSGFDSDSKLPCFYHGRRSFCTTGTNNSNRAAGDGRAGEPSSQNSGDNPKKNDDDKVSNIVRKYLMWITTFWLIVSLVSMLTPNNSQRESVYVSWNDFLHHMLSKGEVKELILRPQIDVVMIILHPEAVIKGRKVGNVMYLMTVSDLDRFEEKLRAAEDKLNIRQEDRVPISYDRSHITASQTTMVLIATALLALLLSRFRSIKPSINMEGFRQMTRAKFTLVDPLTGRGKGVRFDDVAGLQEAKTEVMEFVDYLKHPEHYKTLGAKVPKGAILLGPPGCGKTLLAKAVATEANVPFLSMNGSEFIEIVGGLGAARVRDLFKEAKSRAPCIIYIDEIDAIGKKRASGMSASGSGSSEADQTLNQLLVEMDGMASKEGVIMLASTNRADVLDKALLRPGRFDRHILIDLPTLDEREQIFKHHLKGIKLELGPEAYSKRLAHLTPGFSGADIANVCNEAALHAARFKKKIVSSADVEYAVDRVVGGTEKRQNSMSPTEKRTVAYHEAGHALVAWMLEHTDALLKVTIIPRTNHRLGFAQYTPTDQKLYTTEQLFDRMCMALGGRVAESVTFNRVTTGAKSDLTRVTRMAYAQVQQFGMSSTVGLVSFDKEVTSQKSKKPYSKKLANMMDVEARRLISQAYKRTEQLLVAEKLKLELIAEALLDKETLNYNDVVALIGPPPYGQKNLIEPADFEASIGTLEDARPPLSTKPTETNDSEPNSN